jgi:hypothetical protein
LAEQRFVLSRPVCNSICTSPAPGAWDTDRTEPRRDLPKTSSSLPCFTRKKQTGSRSVRRAARCLCCLCPATSRRDKIPKAAIMWRRTYLFLVLVRLWFALSPSYLHPDENFQGPEVIAGEIFSYPVRRTWEFTSENPIRSVFPLWPVYGLPMLLLRWLWVGHGNDGEVPPIAVFWTLRILMFVLSFVLEDWAIHELVQSPRHRRIAILLVASSYVTWTFQTHTFSNSIETLVVAWSLVLIDRILDTSVRHSRYVGDGEGEMTLSLLPFWLHLGSPRVMNLLANVTVGSVSADLFSSRHDRTRRCCRFRRF